MAHLLHIDSSIQGEQSTSRALTARAARVWRAANPDGTVTYRDLGADPLPHFTHDTGRARMVPAEKRTPAEAASWALTEQVVGEVLEADTIIFGLADLQLRSSEQREVVGRPSDRARALNRRRDPCRVARRSRHARAGIERRRLPARHAARGLDHAAPWLPHGLSLTGLEPRFITVELTLAETNPQMADLKPLAAESLAAAEREIDAQWAPVAA